MGLVGRRDEMVYRGVGLDGWGRSWVDDEQAEWCADGKWSVFGGRVGERCGKNAQRLGETRVQKGCLGMRGGLEWRG